MVLPYNKETRLLGQNTLKGFCFVSFSFLQNVLESTTTCGIAVSYYIKRWMCSRHISACFCEIFFLEKQAIFEIMAWHFFFIFFLSNRITYSFSYFLLLYQKMTRHISNLFMPVTFFNESSGTNLAISRNIFVILAIYHCTLWTMILNYVMYHLSLHYPAFYVLV